MFGPAPGRAVFFRLATSTINPRWQSLHIYQLLWDKLCQSPRISFLFQTSNQDFRQHVCLARIGDKPGWDLGCLVSIQILGEQLLGRAKII